MSNTDSFIDEVNEEVRKDRVYALLRRYGWIGALFVVLIVAGAAWSEYRKAQALAQAEALGDGILAALSADTSDTRVQALTDLPAEGALAQVVTQMLTAGEYASAGQADEAVAILDNVAVNGDVPEIYRQIAGFKAATTDGSSLTSEERRSRLQGLAQPGSPLRLLAEEQLALAEVENGNRDAAIEMYQSILTDAEVTSDLQQRAVQVIVALGGTPEMDAFELQSN